MKYKIHNHIQSLRAFSVISVFLYHTNISLFSNGYLGVDIFFVISGFVITQRIFEDYKEKKIVDLRNFYLKRAKRIIPNLFFIVSITYLFYLFFGPPDLSLFKETLFSLLGLSNLYYVNYSRDYFNNVFEDPLGHTWSLGVEEQFYLIFPLIIYLFYQNKLRNIIYLKFFLFIIFLISLILFATNFKTNPTYSFYLSPLRFWEFLMGTLFYLFRDKLRFNKIIFSFSILIIIFIIFTNQNIINNYFKNIILLLFSGYIISSYQKNLVFENKYFVYLGNISYSFYLWHLPVLFFSDLYVTNVMNIDIFFAFLITIILSIITYFFIEKKFRYLEWKFSYFLNLSIIGIILFSIVLYVKYFNLSLKQEIRNYFYNFNYLEKKYDWRNRVIFINNVKIDNFKVYHHCLETSSNFTLNNLGLRKECLRQKNFSKIFFLFGNSNSAQFLPLLNDLEKMKNIYYLHLAEYNYPSSTTTNILYDNFKEIYLLTNIDTLKRLEIVKDNFKKHKNKNIKLILFTSTPNPIRNEPFKCLIQQKNCFIDKNDNIKKRDLDKLFSEMYKLENLYKDKIFVFNSFEALCPDTSLGCKVYDKENDILVYRDQSHITYEGTKTIAEDFENFLLIRNILN